MILCNLGQFIIAQGLITSSSLKEITVHKDNPCFSTIYDNQMLVDKDIKKVYLSLNSLKGEVVIPEGIVSLESNACAYLDYVTKIVIPSSVLNIETNFSDFSDYRDNCRFVGCSHTCEKGCAVLDAVANGKIEKTRHESYVQMYEEAKMIKEWELKR